VKHIYDPSAQKKAINLSINSDLLDKSKALKLNLSATLERALIEEVRNAIRVQWLDKNKKAIGLANKLVSKRGLFAESYRII